MLNGRIFHQSYFPISITFRIMIPTPQVSSIERLLLKYNQSVRAVCRRYCDFANKARQKEVSAVTMGTQAHVQILSKLEKTIIMHRNLPKRLFCSSFGQVVRFLRELGIVTSPYFSCADLSNCKRRMDAHHRAVFLQKLCDYRRDDFAQVSCH
jgi:hypothetical protein